MILGFHFNYVYLELFRLKTSAYETLSETTRFGQRGKKRKNDKGQNGLA